MTGEPISLAEARANATSDAKKWSALDALKSMIRRIESGEIKPERLAMHYLERDPDDGFTHHHCCAGLTYETHLVLLEIAKQRLLDDWRR